MRFLCYTIFVKNEYALSRVTEGTGPVMSDNLLCKK